MGTYDDLSEGIIEGAQGHLAWSERAAAIVADIDTRLDAVEAFQGLHEVTTAGASSLAVLNGHTYEITASAVTTLALSGLPGCQAAIVWSGEAGTVEGLPMVGGDTAVAVKLTAGWRLFPVGAPTPPDTTPPTAGTLSVVTSTTTADLTVTAAMDETALHATPYRFSKDNGATWTGWQAGATYQFTGLAVSTPFTFLHEVRDAAGNVKVGTAVVKSTETPVVWTMWAEDDFTGADGTIVGRTTPTGGKTWAADGTGGFTAGIVSNALVIDPTADGAASVSIPGPGTGAAIKMRVTFDYEIPADGKTSVTAVLPTNNTVGQNAVVFLRGGVVPVSEIITFDTWSAPTVAVIPPNSGTAVYELALNADMSMLLTVTVGGTLVFSQSGTKTSGFPSSSGTVSLQARFGARYSATPRTFDNFKVAYA